jgi:hypothetical protein
MLPRVCSGNVRALIAVARAFLSSALMAFVPQTFTISVASCQNPFLKSYI